MSRKYTVGERVKAFDPRTLGVVREGEVVGVGSKYLRVDFGLTGVARVAMRDVVSS